MTRPVIGILAAENDEGDTSIARGYVLPIEALRALPLVIPYVKNKELLPDYAELCDGFIVSGGCDVDPGRYMEPRHPACEEPSLLRDEMDFAALKCILDTKKPVLAICRGMQLLNVAMGGTLYQHLPDQYETEISHKQTEPKDAYSHEVGVTAGTPLERIVGTQRMETNSFHHQAIKKLGSGLAVMARADDGLIEAVYLEDHPYLLAYQWHPERLFDRDSFNNAIFRDFIEACKSK